MGKLVWVKMGNGWRSVMTWSKLGKARAYKHAQEDRIRNSISVVVVHFEEVGARFALFTYQDPERKTP